MTGLLVNVFYNPLGDCTAGGVSSKQSRFILVDEKITAPFKVEEDVVYLVLVRRNLSCGEYIHAEPRMNGKKLPGTVGLVGPMMGGNFIYASDSRFPNKYPIPIHDRYETLATYNALSQ